MNLIQFFQCLRGKHLRSRGQARDDGQAIRSKCVGCGKPMIRTLDGWQLADIDMRGE